ncbi:hypothetical protein NFI96_011157 [Prochilodus magdalenae]|nr:hypothetical protein NFI96_011157 [Prochilodus magdalenae]
MSQLRTFCNIPQCYVYAGEEMKHSSLSLMRHASGRQSATMVSLLLLLILILVQPITSQVHVNSSVYDGSPRAPTPKQTNQTQHSVGSPHPTGRTEVPFRVEDQKITRGAETELVVDKNAFVEVSKQGDIVSDVHPEEHNISNHMGEAATYNSNVDLKVELVTHSVSPNIRAKSGLTQTHMPTAKLTSTVPTEHSGHSGKATTGARSVNEGSSHSQDTPTVAGTEPEMEELIIESSEEDFSTLDVLVPTVLSLTESSTEAIERDGAERAQYRPHAQTAYSTLTTVSNAQNKSTPSSALPTKHSTSTQVNEKPVTTSAPNVVNPGVTFPLAGEEREDKTNDTFSARHLSNGSSKLATHSLSPSESPPLNTSTTILPKDIPASSSNPQPRNTTKPATAETASNKQPKGEESSTTTPPEIKIFKSLPPASTTNQQSPTDTATSQSTFPPLPNGQGRLVPLENDARYVEKDLSVSLGSVPSLKPGSIPSTTYISKERCDPALGPCVSSKEPKVLSEIGTSNGSMLIWADLSRTLSFAWELHVFGSAALFLLLAAGSALGLALAPSMHCPHRGALALANGLLLLAGAIRAAYFLLDPYGSRRYLPLHVVTALYTLPLPLLIWVQAAMVVLILKGAELVVLPPSVQRPPFLVVLAVLQCTLLLAADLLSPALSPAVPVVLQSLTLTAGLVLCLGYLCLVLPRLSAPQVGHVGDKGLSGPKLRVLARVLAVCALLGALCCLLHAYNCLWLYGLLGDSRRFRWTWWLCQFWARLLELGWAFCLLLLASWVFWRPRGVQTRRASGQDGTAAGELPSPCQSSTSSHTHTCWAKIVQSLKGRPHRKSESNGVGGSNGGGVAGELPNNWAGQERSGADISKSLIRNRDPPKESNRGRNQRSAPESSAGSLLRLQALGQPRQCSLSGSLDQDKESAISLYDFDLRPPSPIDLSRSIDEALHREHLLRGGSLFRPLGLPSPPPSPEPWMRRNSDPQITLSESSDEHTLLTESSAALDRSIPSAVPSRQVTAPPTPTHQGPRWASEAPVPSSMSCPVSLHPSPSAGRAASPSTDDTRPFLTPEMDREGSQPDSRGGRRYLKVSRQDDSASVSSDIIDL